MEEIDEIRKLSPDERIRKLKEIEKKKQKEIDQAKRLRQQSETEMIIDMTEKKQTPIEQLKASGMDLLIGEEKEIYKTKRFEVPSGPKDLEEIAKAPASEPESSQIEYSLHLAETPIEDMYLQAQGIYAQGPGSVTKDQFYEAMDLQYAIQEKREAIRKGTYSVDEFIDKEIDATMSMVEKIMDWYKG